MKPTGAGKKSGFKPIRTLMSENEEIAPMMRKVALISRLQQTYVNTVPAHLKSTSRIAAVEGTTLIIAVANGAVATSLKQMLPRLLEKINENQKQEQEVTVIRVLVQPEYFGLDIEPKPVKRRLIPTTSMPVEMLSQLTTTLGDSPLKETLKRIQTRRERTLTNSNKSTK